MSAVFSAFDHACMAQALQLAERGLYSTDPNPRVGCVIAKQDSVIGRGFHRKAGAAHAEVAALQEVGASARGATAYVTLEPCSHTGRTPPCAEALIAAGVSRVVAAMQDPNPQVSGSGFEKLRAAGIETAVGLMEAQARTLNPGFVSRMSRGRPWVRSKIAISLDGRTALGNGNAKWISNAAARADVQHWRARSSAIMTGSHTLRVDDPWLTVRLKDQQRQPLRVVVDSALTTPPTARLFSAPGEICVATLARAAGAGRALEAAGATVLTLPELAGRVDLAALLAALAARECNEVLVEAGAGLNGALLQAGLLDELIVYLAPHLLGSSARSMFELPAISAMAERHELTLTDLRQIGNNIRLMYRLG